MKNFLKKINDFLSNDIGIDLGTANTLVYMRGKGIVVSEPSVVAVNQKTKQVVAVGMQAKDMLGRTPAHISAVRPIVGGVISDFEVTEELISYLVRRAEGESKKLLGPRVVVGVPYGITNVETRAVWDATRNAGARKVYIVEEPVAAAIGIKLPIFDPVGSMIVDIGGGTTDIAIMSLGGIVKGRNVKIAGDRLSSDIISYIRTEFKILIGEKTAEEVKLRLGILIPEEHMHEMKVRGRDLVTGLPREIVITDSDIRDALSISIGLLVSSIEEVLESAPPEILSDIMHRGLYVVGGGALLRGLSQVLHEHLHLDVKVDDDPLTAVARGCGTILENLELYSDFLIQTHDELPPKK